LGWSACGKEERIPPQPSSSSHRSRMIPLEGHLSDSSPGSSPSSPSAGEQDHPSFSVHTLLLNQPVTTSVPSSAYMQRTILNTSSYPSSYYARRSLPTDNPSPRSTSPSWNAVNPSLGSASVNVSLSSFWMKTREKRKSSWA